MSKVLVLYYSSYVHSPCGASTIAGGQGQRQPSAIELEGARHQGKLIAETATQLFG